MLFYDIKQRCMLYKIFGARNAFLNMLVLPDGSTPSETVKESPGDLTLLLPRGG